MAEEQQPYSDKVLKQQKELNVEGAEFLRILKEQTAAQKELAQTSKDRRLDTAYINKETKYAVQLANKLLKYNRSDLQNRAKRKAFEQNQQDVVTAQVGIQSEIDRLLKLGNVKSLRRAEILSDQLSTSKQTIKASKELTKEYRNLDKVTGFFTGFEDIVKDIPVVSKLLGGLTKGSKVAGEAYAKGDKVAKSVFKGGMSFGKGMAKLGIATLIASLVEGLVAVNETTVKLTRSMGLGAEGGNALTAELRGVANQKADIGALADSAQGMSAALGSAAAPTAKAVYQATILSKRLGISAETSARLYKVSVTTGKTFESTTNSIIGQTKALNATSNVSLNYRQVLDDVAKVSASTLLTSSKFPGGITKAAFEARKLGLSFESLNQTSSSMLDFENSIASELEAELLTGKQLNLQKAREAALMGDQATLAKEVSKQVGSSAEFGAMNVLQQEAVAKAIGMSRQDLAESLVQREALLKLEEDSGIAGLAKLSTEEKIAALIKQGKTEVEALQALGMDEMATQAAAKTAAESMKGAMKSLGGKLALLMTAVTGLQDPLQGVTNVIQYLTKVMEKSFDSVIGDSFTIEQKRAGFDKLKSSVTDDELKAKGMSRKEFEKHIERASYQKGLFGMTSDYAFATNAGIEESREKLGTIRANDFTIKTHPKDTLAMAGGTQFGKETNDLLRELVREVKASGNTYLDSRKISEVMRLNAYEQ